MLPAEAEELHALCAARRMLGGEVKQLSGVVGRGRNSRVYRVVDGRGTDFALKTYLRQADDPRDRLGAEFGGLRFLWLNGVRNVPEAVAVDARDGAALYGWLDGQPIAQPGAGDIDAAVAFLARLRDLSWLPEAARLPPAAEACLSGAEILRQVAGRRDRLAAIEDASLQRFLAARFDPLAALAAERAAVSGNGFEAVLAGEYRTLSPSDFGFHNALRARGGVVIFLDFEYFGWDDPVKLVADFLLHPGMTLPSELAARFRQGAEAVYGGEGDYARRLDRHLPLFALRWALIALNEFLPQRQVRRRFAGLPAVDADLLAGPLALAGRILQGVAQA